MIPTDGRRRRRRGEAGDGKPTSSSATLPDIAAATSKRQSVTALERDLPTSLSVSLLPQEGAEEQQHLPTTTSTSSARRRSGVAASSSSSSCVFNIDDVIDDAHDAVRELISTSAAIDHVMRELHDG